VIEYLDRTSVANRRLFQWKSWCFQCAVVALLVGVVVAAVVFKLRTR